MIEPDQPGRIDLRACIEPVGPDRAEFIIQAALARARPGLRVSRWLARWSGPLLAASALLVLVALGLMMAASARAHHPEPAAVLAEWLSANHVPTNGEILAAFQGYLP